ncbi:hypothetical protein BV898_01233 [Hypsibius exemplaris]|uniref:G-protein coupled receptors family 1 profile domain-containing protein n=1 Tax=Hypsibius exemplaris TaxID=2072580 RepID=A0A1W0XBZ7_HYPEX|nr:hypothetical protein BV898_01233 [Hypsibius exemplaris]
MNILNTAADSFGSEATKIPGDVRKFAEPFLTMCQLTNYSVNFIMYVTFSKRFREQFEKIFLPTVCRDRLRFCCRCRERQPEDMNSSDDDARLRRGTLNTASTSTPK